jgi:hypothetical protein
VLLLEVVVTEVDDAEVGEEVEVELRPLSVKAMSPLPSKTIPRPSWQQAGSLSQQKLPSLQTFTRGRKPSEPPSEGVLFCAKVFVKLGTLIVSSAPHPIC